jgi:hypothetical protein|tara:strand:- start:1823 stop:2329 length:507 start_codon:yes stop_codon:yes gene_type:complete
MSSTLHIPPRRPSLKRLPNPREPYTQLIPLTQKGHFVDGHLLFNPTVDRLPVSTFINRHKTIVGFIPNPNYEHNPYRKHTGKIYPSLEEGERQGEKKAMAKYLKKQEKEKQKQEDVKDWEKYDKMIRSYQMMGKIKQKKLIKTHVAGKQKNWNLKSVDKIYKVFSKKI